MRLFAKTFNVFLALSLRLRKERRCSIKESVVKNWKERRKKRETLVLSKSSLSLCVFFLFPFFFSLGARALLQFLLSLSLSSLLSSQKTSQTQTHAHIKTWPRKMRR